MVVGVQPGKFDVVVVGAGSTGAALAVRLTEDPTCRVLLLEAGRHYPSLEALPDDVANFHGVVLRHDWDFRANLVSGRQPGSVAKRVAAHDGAVRVTEMGHYLRGKIAGGSSAVNGGIAVRGRPEDFDEWAGWGNPEWSWDRVLPAYKQLETDVDFGDEYHGRSGPVPVVRVPDGELTSEGVAFLRGCQEIGIPRIADFNAPQAEAGAAAVPMNRMGPLRVSTAIAYLLPATGRPNLHIVDEALVDRVIVTAGRATGVDYIRSGRGERATAGEVVLCAGSVGDPALLWRSGIGPAGPLSRLGIDVVVDAPGVGANAIDQPGFFLLIAPRVTEGGLARQRGRPVAPVMARATVGDSESGSVILQGLNQIDTKVWPVPLRVAAASMVGASLYRPQSRGSVRLAGKDPDAVPLIDLNMLDAEADRARLRAAVRAVWTMVHGAAYCDVVDDVLNLDQCTVDDDGRLDAKIAAESIATYHISGTCRMGAGDDDVVDQHLRVRGVDSLRVASAAIMPNIVRSPTNLTSIMIGERAAALVSQA